MAEFDTSEVVPSYYCLFTSLAVMGSALLYRDLENSSLDNLFIFLSSLTSVALGVVLVARVSCDS